MEWAKIFRALGHEVRYTLFMHLLSGTGGQSCCDAVGPGENACCVVDLTQVLPLAQSTVSHHLRILVEAGLVRQERRGTYRIYAVKPQTLCALGKFLHDLSACPGAGPSYPVGIQSDP